MSYKTILVHLNDPSRARNVLGSAMQLARAFDARVIGLYVFPTYRLFPPVPMPFAKQLAGKIKAALKKETDDIKNLFSELTADDHVVSEWRSITTERRHPAEVVIEQARAADLVIASQANPAWSMSEILDFPDRLAIESGRPVLVIPNRGETAPVPRIVTVAWNGRRESARAVADALPLLKRADLVHVVSVEEGRQPREGMLPDADIAAALSRHGVRVELSRVKVENFTVGEEIRTRATDQKADLLVMGCYGHSRMREYALGGVTRHILGNMTIPVLFSH